MDLTDIRARIDEIDDGILSLFCERMGLASAVAEAKRGSGRAVFDPARERDKLARAAAAAPGELEPYVTSLFSLLMSMNKAEQQKVMRAGDPEAPSAVARASYLDVDSPFPTTADGGVPGGRGSVQPDRRVPAVPRAEHHVLQHLRGRLPRRARRVLRLRRGTDRELLGGLRERRATTCSRSTASPRSSGRCAWRFDHQLLAKPGTRLADITEVHSHEQAVAQCAGFPRAPGLPAGLRVAPDAAMAAELVAKKRPARRRGALLARLRGPLRPLTSLESRRPGHRPQLHALHRHLLAAAGLPRGDPHLPHADGEPRARLPVPGPRAAATRWTSTSSTGPRAVRSPGATSSSCSTSTSTAPPGADRSTCCSTPSTTCASAARTSAPTRRWSSEREPALRPARPHPRPQLHPLALILR